MDVLMDECTHNAEPPPQVWWEAETIITDKKMVADNTDLTIIIIIILRLYYICACMLHEYRTYTPYQSYVIPSRSSALMKFT